MLVPNLMRKAMKFSHSLNNFVSDRKIRKRYDVTGVMYVELGYHLVIVEYFLTNVGAKFDANRANIASAVSNSFCTWKKPMMPYG